MAALTQRDQYIASMLHTLEGLVRQLSEGLDEKEGIEPAGRQLENLQNLTVRMSTVLGALFSYVEKPSPTEASPAQYTKWVERLVQFCTTAQHGQCRCDPKDAKSKCTACLLKEIMTDKPGLSLVE